MDFVSKIQAAKQKNLITPDNYEGPTYWVEQVSSINVRSIYVELGVPESTLQKLLNKFALLSNGTVPYEIVSEQGEKQRFLVEAEAADFLPKFDVIEQKHLSDITLILTMGCLGHEEGKEAEPAIIQFTANAQMFEYLFNWVKTGQRFNIMNGFAVNDISDHAPTEAEKQLQYLFFGFKPDVVPVRYMSAA